MAKHGEKMLSELADAKAALVELTHGDYQAAEVRDLVSTLGAKIEIFLKSVVFPGGNARYTFEYYINELVSGGVGQQSIDDLHLLRRKYNAAKHDPNIMIQVLEAIQLLDGATTAIAEIVTLRLGSVDAVVTPHMQRVFWIAVWDHYIHGDSEVHIILPGESAHWLGPPALDTIYVKGVEWDTIAASLPYVGRFVSGQGLIPDKQYTAFRADSDFYGAWVFEGEYRNLITTLAQYELRQDLIPGLNRHDDPSSMILAFLLAGLDVLAAVNNPNDLAAAIIQQATTAYAVPQAYQYSQYLADHLAQMLVIIPQNEWANVTGPVWINAEHFEQTKATSRAMHSKYDILIGQDLVVRMKRVQ